jgi:tetratricopeptide (TPR) repeat protein
VFFKFALAAVLLCALVGCSRSPAHPERMAVFAFENLTGDSSLDWASRAAAEYTVDSMAGSKTLCAALALSNDDLWNARATRALRGYFSVSNGRLYLAARLEDTARTRTVANFAVDGAASNGLLPLAEELVRRLDAPVTPSRARHAGAWKAYVEALAHTPAEAAPLLERALSMDPDFAPAIFVLARLRIAMGDRAAANKVVADAVSRRSRLSEIHAAKLDFMAASLGADPLTRFRAVSRLATLVPADSDLAREAAEAATAARDYPAAAGWYERATLAEPSYGALWNQLGYARSYLKDLKGAVDAIEHYGALSPGSANPSDSLGDVHFYLGRFDGAERYYLAAYEKDPKFLAGGTLFKAAQARLMLRDMPAAGALFEKYAAARRQAGDPAIEFTRAQWEYLSGKRKQAIARLEPLAASVPRAAIQLAVWHLDMGDRDAARAAAGKAPQAATAQDAELFLMARFLSEPPASASEWALRAERAFPAPAQTGVKKYALAYALLFSRQYDAASLVLKEIVARTGPGSTDNAPALYGWALVETGHKREAAPLIEVFPIPMPNGFSLFACLSYPRQLTLRAGS